MKQNGGIRIKPNYTAESALLYFLTNSSFSILEHDSLYSIPIVATLRNDKTIIENSPYRTVRTNYFNTPVTCLLLKFFLWGIDDGMIDDVADMFFIPSEKIQVTGGNKSRAYKMNRRNGQKTMKKR